MNIHDITDVDNHQPKEVHVLQPRRSSSSTRRESSKRQNGIDGGARDESLASAIVHERGREGVQERLTDVDTLAETLPGDATGVHVDVDEGDGDSEENEEVEGEDGEEGDPEGEEGSGTDEEEDDEEDDEEEDDESDSERSEDLEGSPVSARFFEQCDSR